MPAPPGVLSGPAIERIQESPLRRLSCSTPSPLPEEKNIDKIVTLPVAPTFAEAIERIYEDKPLGTMFND